MSVVHVDVENNTATLSSLSFSDGALPTFARCLSAAAADAGGRLVIIGGRASNSTKFGHAVGSEMVIQKGQGNNVRATTRHPCDNLGARYNMACAVSGGTIFLFGDVHVHPGSVFVQVFATTEWMLERATVGDSSYARFQIYPALPHLYGAVMYAVGSKLCSSRGALSCVSARMRMAALSRRRSASIWRTLWEGMWRKLPRRRQAKSQRMRPAAARRELQQRLSPQLQHRRQRVRTRE